LVNPYLLSIIAGITTPPEAAREGIISCPSENAKEVFTESRKILDLIASHQANLFLDPSGGGW
jgi:hypothetical protein